MKTKKYLQILIFGLIGIFIVACAMPMSNPGSISVKGKTALHDAACKGDIEEVKRLLNKGYKANDRFWYYKKDDGENALNSYFRCLPHYGNKAKSVDLGLVALLIDSGANPNVMSSQEVYATPLELLVQSPDIPNRFEAVKLLISKGADGYVTQHGNYGAIPRAVLRRDIEMLKYLIDLGVPINSKAIQGRVFYAYGDRFESCSGPIVDHGISKEPTPEWIKNRDEVFEKNKVILAYLFSKGLVLDKKVLSEKSQCQRIGEWSYGENLLIPYIKENFSDRMLER